MADTVSDGTDGTDRGRSDTPDTTDTLERHDGYRRDWEAYVVLRDGSVAHVRPITPGDADALRRFHDAQSEESVYLRFFAPLRHLSDRDVERFTHVDNDSRVALVATVGEDIIGIARYDRLDDPSDAEVAFNISDHYQGRGVGSVLLEHLAAIATEAGVQRFVADVLPQNRKMMKVFTDAGYQVAHHFDDGVIAVEFRIEPTDESQAVQLAREHRAEAQSMHAVLSPSSIAVIGVSRRPDAIGSIVLDNVIDAGFTGQIHVVNSEADTVRGLRAHRRVSDIGEPIDLAVVAVPAEAVLDVVDDCAAAGVRTLLVVSTGFAEAGPEGEARQEALLHRARTAGIRVIGPNSLGLVNTTPDIRLDATLARRLPGNGTLGLFAQSGGLGLSLLAASDQRGLGISVFASAGNRIDVSGNDVMRYWIDDDSTKAVGVYLESVGNARKFSRIARQLSLRKPVVCVKSATNGQVTPGHRARTTHVGMDAFRAMLAQAGVIQAGSIRELIHICEMVTHQPLPAGDRLAVLGNSPGLNAIAASTALAEGLKVTRGPLGLEMETSAREVATAVEEALADPSVDSVIVTLMPPFRSSEEEIAGAIAHVSWASPKPLVSVFVGTRDVTPVMRRAGRLISPETGQRRIVPVHTAPLEAVPALAAAARYAAWRRADHGERVHPTGIDRRAARRLVQGVLAETPQGRELHQDEVRELLADYGIEVWPTVAVRDADEAVAAANELGYPVVVKSMIPSVRSRPGAGAMRDDLQDDAAVRAAFTSIGERLAVFGDPRIVVQRMATPGVPTVLATTEDPLFGPVVSFGIAGAPRELLGDVTHRIPPLTDVDVAALVTTLQAAPMLLGHNGSPGVDVAALEDTIARVSVLADEIPEVAHLALHTLNAHPGGCEVLGAQARVAPASARADAGRRALT